MKWPMHKIDEIFHVARGGSPRPIQQYLTDRDDGINWIMIGDASDKSKYITRTKKRIIPEGITKSRMVHTGDFLLSNSMSFGRPYILKTSGCIHDGWLALSPKIDEINPDFFYYLLGSEKLYREFSKRASGAVVKNLNTSIVKSVQIPLPALNEQKRIATILDAADDLRQKTKALIAKYDELSQSLFIEMFGDTWTNPFKWPLKYIHEIASNDKHSIKAGPFGSSLKKEYYVSSGYKIYGQEQVINDNLDFGDYYITNEKYNELKSCAIRAGDILISLVGTYGKIAVVPDSFEPGIINPRLMKITPNNELIRSDFLKRCLQSDGAKMQMSSKSRGGTMDIINVGIIRSIQIPLPPLSLQNLFAERVQAIEAQKIQAEQSLQQAEDLFNSLLQKAFKGELGIGHR